jgi:hypothetical protein
LEDASFCGLVFDCVQKVALPDPRKHLLKMGWAARRYVNCSARKLNALLRLKGLSLLCSFPGAPVVQELALYALRVTKEATKYQLLKTARVAAEGDMYMHEAMVRAVFAAKRVKPVTAESRMLCERTYGLGVREQIRIETYLRNKKDLSPLDVPCQFSQVEREYYDLYHVAPGTDPNFAPISTIRNELWLAQLRQLISVHS